MSDPGEICAILRKVNAAAYIKVDRAKKYPELVIANDATPPPILA